MPVRARADRVHLDVRAPSRPGSPPAAGATRRPRCSRRRSAGSRPSTARRCSRRRSTASARPSPTAVPSSFGIQVVISNLAKNREPGCRWSSVSGHIAVGVAREGRPGQSGRRVGPAARRRPLTKTAVSTICFTASVSRLEARVSTRRSRAPASRTSGPRPLTIAMPSSRCTWVVASPERGPASASGESSDTWPGPSSSAGSRARAARAAEAPARVDQGSGSSR